ncbi:MAG: CtsR family transcriptional regulator, partial [Clostridiales bacterium]|nr:CtsR family transcriptional regulator [Clostridiales bacterium]
EREASIIKSALVDKVIAIPANLRGVIRANILKAMLVAILRSRCDAFVGRE